MKDISVEHFGDAEASAEGSHLALFCFDGMKGRKKQEQPRPSIDLWR